MLKRLSDIHNDNVIVFIDASVLIYVHGSLIQSDSYVNYMKQNDYARTIGALLKTERKLVTTWLSVAEVLHVHERHMYVEYKALLGQQVEFTKKDFRRIPAQRLKVQKELKRILNEMLAYYTLLSVDTNATQVDQFVKKYTVHTYDPNDYLALEAVISKSISAVITDDADFYNDNKLTVYSV